LAGSQRLGFGLAIVKSVSAVIDTEILEREFAFAIVKGAAATKTGQWLIICRRGFNPNDFVFCSAVWAMEASRVCHTALIASNSGV
jgi:hypothetical protein